MHSNHYGNHDNALLNPVFTETESSNKELTRSLVREYLINLLKH